MNRFLSPFLLASALVLPINAALANFSLRFDLESRIQEKVHLLLNPFDPYSQVLVTVHLKELTVELPGVNAEPVHMDSNTTPTTISLEDIDSIQVSVITQLDPIPESLKATLESAIDIPAQKKHFEFKKISADAMKLIPPADTSVSRGFALADELFRRFSWLFILAGVGIFVLVFGIFFKRSGQSSQTEVLKNIADGMKELASSGMGSSSGAAQAHAAKMDTEARATSSRTGNKEQSASDRDWIQALGVEGLTSLLSDCYWCEEDAYAAWIWKQIRPDLAQELFKKWHRAREYFGALSGTVERASQYHHHPYYLKPLALEDVSLEDLQAWLKRNPFAWNELSPLRQAKFNLSLMERIHFSENQKGASSGSMARLPELPKASLKIRALQQPFSMGELSEQDELAILENPGSVPVGLRSQIQSLVWTALLSEENRKEVLGKIQAQGLAEIWVGPEVVLNLISESLPEKKRTLVSEYQKKSKPTASSARASEWMAYLVQESLQVLDTNPIASVTSISSSSDSDAA